MTASRRTPPGDSGRKGKRDLRTQDFATADARPATLAAGTEEFDPLPNRRYTSILFWRLARALDPQAPPRRILDLGPTADSNIRFWAELGFTVTCYDLVARATSVIADVGATTALTRDRVRQMSLPYPEEGFSAICGWNSLAQLPFVVGQQYVRECYRLLYPSGLMHAIFLDAGARLDSRREYRVADRQQLDVLSREVPRASAPEVVDAELSLLLGRFDACQIKAAPCQTREVLVQKAPTDHFPA